VKKPAPQQPAWMPEKNPIRLKCEGNRVFGWVYEDGTLELICRDTAACKRNGMYTRHLFNPASGVSFPIYIPREHSE
jgi:hypothetical protein